MFVSKSLSCPYTPCKWQTCGFDERAREAAREVHMIACVERLLRLVVNR